MFVGDVQHDLGVAWILPAYHQYRLPLCCRVMVEISLSPTFDSSPDIFKAKRHHIVIVESMRSDEGCFFLIWGVHGDLVIT